MSVRCDSRPRLAAKARLKWDRHEAKYMLLYPERGLALNEAASAVLLLCDGDRTIASIAGELAAERNATCEAIECDAIALLEELWRRGVIEIEGEVASDGAPGVSTRRSAIARREAAVELRPYTLIAELTYRCPLHCPYCSNPVDLARHAGELKTEEWVRVFGEAEALGVVQLHFTGGEPLARADLEELVAAASDLGVYKNLITSGVPLERERLAALKSAGLDNVQLSIQHVDGERADAIAGYAGHAHKLEVAAWVKELGLPLTINVVLHRDNLDQVDELIALAERLRADRIELANTQYHGWALENRARLIPTADQIERGRVAAAAAKQRLAGAIEVVYVNPDYFSERPKACMDGWARRYLHINPTGHVLPCHAAMSIESLQFETVRDQPLEWIWRDSPSFNAFRGEAWMAEPCQTCERRMLDFGGCRCQAFQLTGNATRTDPACGLSPDHGIIEAAVADLANTETSRFVPRSRLARRSG